MVFLIYIVLLVFLCLYLGKAEISFSPFRFEMENWRTVVAVILFYISYNLFMHDRRLEWKKDLFQIERLDDMDKDGCIDAPSEMDIHNA